MMNISPLNRKMNYRKIKNEYPIITLVNRSNANNIKFSIFYSQLSLVLTTLHSVDKFYLLNPSPFHLFNISLYVPFIMNF